VRTTSPRNSGVTVGERISDDEREERGEKADPHRIEEHARIERLHQRREICQREAARLKRTGHVGAQAVLHHRCQRGQKAERAQHGRRHEQAQKRPSA
jgi:phosphatidate phosphatase PAH1